MSGAGGRRAHPAALQVLALYAGGGEYKHPREGVCEELDHDEAEEERRERCGAASALGGEKSGARGRGA